LRDIYEPEPPDRLNVPAIDRIVNVFDHVHSSKQCPVIEITSGTAGAGKTHLLYYLITATVLPGSLNGRTWGGKGGAAIVLDTEGTFDVNRLVLIMETYVERMLGKIGEADDNVSDAAPRSLIINALQHVHIFRPHSLASLVSTIQSIPAYMFSFSDHYSTNRGLELVALDSITAFFWQSKNAEETERFETAAQTIDHRKPANDKHQQFVDGLRDLQKQFGCAIVATSWGISPVQPQHPGSSRSFRPVLPPIWQSFCTLRLVVARDVVKKFPHDMSVEQARKDAGERQTAVEEGNFSAWVDQWASDSWSDDVWKRLKSSERNGSFTFRITNDGLEMGD